MTDSINSPAIDAPANQGKKIWFAQMLRGLACLCVVYRHIFEVFWYAPHKDVSAVLSANVESFHKLFTVQIAFLTGKMGSFNLGAFGVSMFFLISGFVISMSLEKKTIHKFLVNRFFRVIPTCAFTLSLASLGLFLYAEYQHVDYVFSLKQFLANITLLPREIMGIPQIDPVMWTLEVEARFYIVIALIGYLMGISRARSVIAFVALMTLGGIFGGHLATLIPAKDATSFVALRIVNDSTFYLSYMFIGVCFFNLYRQHWDYPKFLQVFSCVGGLVILNVMFGSNSYNYKLMFCSSYGLGLVVFTLLYRLRDRLKYFKPLDELANMSYSLYLCHQISGYIFMELLLRVLPNSPLFVSALGFGFVLILARAIYLLIERPSIRLSKKFG